MSTLRFLVFLIAGIASAATTLDLPGNPFAVVTSRDGSWIFVSLMDQGKKDTGVAVLRRGEGGVELVRVAHLDKAPAGMVITHDGKVLIAAAGDAVFLLDVGRLEAGKGDAVILSFSDGNATGSIGVNVTADDKLLFVSEERAQTITVVDLERVRLKGNDGGAIIGKIPVGMAPIALTFSPDGRWLYSTSQGARPDWAWPAACTAEGLNRTDLTRPEGAVVVVDVNRAKTDPSNAVAARVPAGCSPVRMAMSPSGHRIYVTARNSNAVSEFDTGKLVSDSAHARLGMANVGIAPVPVVVIDGGKKVVAGNSNRFGGPTTPSTLTVLDATKIAGGGDAVMGTVLAGAFPRDLVLSPDGRTLYVANFGSKSLLVLDVGELMEVGK